MRSFKELSHQIFDNFQRTPKEKCFPCEKLWWKIAETDHPNSWIRISQLNLEKYWKLLKISIKRRASVEMNLLATVQIEMMYFSKSKMDLFIFQIVKCIWSWQEVVRVWKWTCWQLSRLRWWDQRPRLAEFSNLPQKGEKGGSFLRNTKWWGQREAKTVTAECSPTSLKIRTKMCKMKDLKNSTTYYP